MAEFRQTLIERLLAAEESDLAAARAKVLAIEELAETLNDRIDQHVRDDDDDAGDGAA